MTKSIGSDFFILLLVLFFTACGGASDDDSDSSSSDSDDSDDETDDAADDVSDDADDSASADDSADDTGDDSTDDSADDTADDTQDDDTSDDTGDDDATVILDRPPDDGRLYAAAAHAVITPDEINHPGPIYLGGTSRDRIATGVHDDLLASALLLATHEEYVVLVSLDLVGFTRSRTKHIQEKLALLGFDPTRVFIASTHTHEGPDTVGIWGPDDFTSGASPTYAEFLEDTVTQLVASAWADLVPVTMRAGMTAIDEPASNIPSLINDSRDPDLVVNRLGVAAFDDDEGSRIATLVNWNSHPEANICTTEITSDFPHYLRTKTESLYGGTTVYISGVVGGLATPLGVHVPGRDDAGNPILDADENPVLFHDCTWDHMRSIGFILSEYVGQVLSGAETDAAPPFWVDSETLWLPIQNILLWLGFHLGVIDYDLEDVIDDRPGLCGLFGCTSEQIGVIHLGSVVLVTSPGETFAETLLGRSESAIDYGGTFGPFTFPAMTGYETFLTDTIPMHMGLCNDEIGYMVPSSDFHEMDHPDYYEEGDALGFNNETYYRERVIRMLTEN